MNAPPVKEKAPGAVQGAEGLAENTENDVIVGGADAQRKHESNLGALAAIAGIAVQGTSDGGWLASRWNLSRSFASLDELSGWLDRVTGAHHDPGPRERERRAEVDAANRRQDQLDEAADFLRGPGGER